ncbi:TetR/AcrR family transcriptional regulator [Shimia thalassica]|uniref:TetR/AcrR family transcriptional regulator n=1 Tax=Shimia thalassica TaxID=1715693 RepID=UPI002735032A|nr:TetR/AcrR family transcriptional regulator [Shimia thalassica]MDP2495139.1 TetR/AcrR family transcriptional regulator [Shimia thalassica]
MPLISLPIDNLKDCTMARAASYDRDTALDAALSLFWDKGYHATSLKDLEASLKMKPGSIYAAFSSKENLYLLALDRYFNTSRDQVRAQMAQADTPLDGLADHFRSYADLAPDATARQACMLTKTLVDTQKTDPVLARQTTKYLSEIRDEFAGAFEQAKQQGQLPADADPNRLARRFQANVTALRIEMHQGTPQNEIADLAEDMAQEVERLKV